MNEPTLAALRAAFSILHCAPNTNRTPEALAGIIDRDTCLPELTEALGALLDATTEAHWPLTAQQMVPMMQARSAMARVRR